MWSNPRWRLDLLYFVLNKNVLQTDIQFIVLLDFLSLLRRLQFYCSLHPNFLICFVLTLRCGAFVVNKCIFLNSFQISVYLNHFANKSNIQETCCSRIFIVACWQLISAPNFYCCDFNGRAVPFEFVRKSRVESGFQCVTNGAENSSS